MQRLFIFLVLLLFTFSRPLQAGPLRPVSYPDLLQILSKATNNKIYEKDQWLRLGHYQKDLWGNYSSEADGEKFFLSPSGKISPKDELLATLRAFAEPIAFEGDRYHPQCRFLARRDWLFKELNLEEKMQKLPCSYQTEWKKKLNAEKVSLIFASAYMNNPSSMFGHTFLKFHTRGNDSKRDLLNYGVNYAAETGKDSGIPFALLGLVGGYKGFFSMQIYYLKLLEYSDIEGRDIWEYELNLKPNEIDFLINHLLELEQTYFDYYFLSENCSYHLLKALEVARPDLNLSNQLFYHVIPADTVRLIASVPNLIAKRSARPSLITEFNARYKLLSENNKSSVQSFIKHPDFSKSSENNTSLSVEEQISFFDTINSWLAIQDYENHSKWKEIVYTGKVARAKIGHASPDIAVLPATAAPEEGHKPAKISLAYGNDDISDKSFLDLQFRAAYHNLSDPPKGFLKNSQIEVFHWRIRQYLKSSETRLTEFKLLDIVSASSINKIFKPISWRVSQGYENFLNRDFYLRGGPGLTLALNDNIALMGFIDADLNYAEDRASEGLRTYWGPGSLFLWNINRDIYKFVFLFSGQWQKNFRNAQERRKLKFSETFTFMHNWQFQISASTFDESSLKSHEVLGQMSYMFLW